MRKRVKYEWYIFIEDGYLNVFLNGGLNTAIPVTSEGLQGFKEEKRAEIEFYRTFTKTSVRGIELLG